MTSSLIEVGGKERIDFREDRLMYDMYVKTVYCTGKNPQVNGVSNTMTRKC